VGTAIQTHVLTKRFGSTIALEQLELSVPEGVIFGYLGPNGAGKTTTIKLLAGLLRPTSGSAAVLGYDATRERRRVHARLGYLPGDYVAYPDLTSRQYVEFLGHLRSRDDSASADRLAKRLALDLDQRIGTLSHGNRQKVGIVQAFMHEPDLFVLDEPTSGLDPIVQREFLDLLRETRDSGRTVFLSSHILSEVEAVADLVAILRSGRLVVTQSIDGLKATATRRIDLYFDAEPPVAALRAVSGVQEVTLSGGAVHVVLTGSTDALIRTAAPHGVHNIVTHEPDLEEVFLSFYAEAG
jgi:ABC-2 type transport system ATP-binding protein